MSTFDGIVQEFPYIQIDYFRKNPERPAPLACFLSHVHSDHLQGLESFRAPFIYCSAATRELLLRIEKYPHRMNFNKGILESRRLHYKHLSKLLRPIPLDTPTEIELTPRLSIRVTLLDANHCIGAVMFLIEGDGQAILYTGDIRAETWWVNGLIRHPVLIPYTLGNKSLDKVYLDTTFARSSHVYRSFPSKAEGLAELLQKVTSYPDDTTFYFRAWTFGYEDVWVALSARLNSKIHVDRYQIGLYRSLASTGDATAPALCGFELGNRVVPGCLSEDEHSRIHSCEPGVSCSAIPSRKPVYIIPIVNRTRDGSQIPEKGAGGGGGDLYQVHELELPDHTALERLEQLCLERIHDAQALAQTRQMLSEAFQSRSKALSLDSYGMKDEEDIPLEKLVNMLSRGHAHNSSGDPTLPLPRPSLEPDTPLPRVIHFPYSRHSSYTELCTLIAAFKPRDIYPCTVDPLTWDESVSIQHLFSHLCTGNTFVHDKHMRKMLATDEDLRSRKRARLHPPPSQTESSPSMQLDGSSFEQERYATQPSQSDSIPPAAREGITQASTSSAQMQIPIPSSLETIDDTIFQLNEATSMPDAASDVERTTRAHLRRAWQFLHDASAAQDGPVFELAPLPASLAADDEDGQDEGKCEDGESHCNPAGTCADHPADIHPENPVNPPSIPSPAHDEHGPEPEHEHEHECNESQPSQTLSISSSAFASSQDYFDIEPSKPNTSVESGSVYPLDERDDDVVPPSLEQSASSRSRRKAAYLAARADDYDAWASVSLVSAGNNHTEKETEL